MADNSDDDTFTFIPAQIRLTPFDRRLKELRELQAQYEELSKQPNRERRLAGLGYQILKAKERFEEEKRRDGDDVWRRRRDVDDWRAGEGRELRNASRRNPCLRYELSPISQVGQCLLQFFPPRN